MIFVECKKENKRMKNFFESLIDCIYEMGNEIFFKFGKWLLLSGEHLHSKHHGATYA